MFSNLVILAENFPVQFFRVKVIGLGLYQILSEVFEAKARLVVIAALHPYLHDDVLKFSLFSQIPEQRLDLANDHLKHIDLVLQDIEDMILQGLAYREIEDKDISVLANPVQPADPLLDPHRIPGEIEIDQGVAELQVSALAARFGGKENR